VTGGPVLRAGRDGDAEGFIALISACWAEYPGCVMDLDGEVPELRALASYYGAKGGALWAAEQGGRVVGMVGTAPLDGGAPGDVWEICKMYAYAAQRGTGLAQALIAAAEGHARGRGATAMRLWSDTRFDRAHRFYEKCSYVRAGPIRVLDDLSHSLEFEYGKPLAGVDVRVLDAAAAGSAVARLAEFAGQGRGFWKAVASDVAVGAGVLLAGWCDGVLAGAAVLGLETAEDGRHRASLRVLMVAPEARRRGIGRGLLRAAEAAAREAGRELLTLDGPAGGAAERLCLSEGWVLLGTIPGWSRGAGASFLWRRL
jgi:GNAT superfamily N-acetyltransferase